MTSQATQGRLEGRPRELAEAPNFTNLITRNADGSLHSTVVWQHVDDRGLIRLNSAEGRRWPANVRRDPRVLLTIMNLENPYEYVVIEGRVVEDTHEGADQEIDELAKKYLGLDRYPWRAQGEVRIRFAVEPLKVRHHGA